MNEDEAIQLLREVKVKVNSIEETVQKLDKAVFVGNGEPAIKSEVAANRIVAKEHEKRISKIESWLTWTVRLVLGSLIGQILLIVYKGWSLKK